MIPKEILTFQNAWEVADWVSKQISKARVDDQVSERLNEAHEYVQKYCMPEGWNKIVWHTILDDAIRMRKEGK